jgi:hypothetical protein
MDINMIFTIPVEFCVPTEDVMELALGVERVVFEKLENPGTHMKPPFIWGHLDGMPIGTHAHGWRRKHQHLAISLFMKLDHIEGDLKHTNLSLSSFACDPTEAKGIIYKELTVGSRTVPTAFFVVYVKGCYNVLLG